MTLHEAQVAFATCVGKLLTFADEHHLEVTLGEVWRTPEQAAWNATHGRGIVNSLHCRRLAIDLNLFRDGDWLTVGNEPEFRTLGAYWKTLHPLACWGGDFRPGADPGHFSLEWDGVR